MRTNWSLHVSLQLGGSGGQSDLHERGRKEEQGEREAGNRRWGEGVRGYKRGTGKREREEKKRLICVNQ